MVIRQATGVFWMMQVASSGSFTQRKPFFLYSRGCTHLMRMPSQEKKKLTSTSTTLNLSRGTRVKQPQSVFWIKPQFYL